MGLEIFVESLDKRIYTRVINELKVNYHDVNIQSAVNSKTSKGYRFILHGLSMFYIDECLNVITKDEGVTIYVFGGNILNRPIHYYKVENGITEKTEFGNYPLDSLRYQRIKYDIIGDEKVFIPTQSETDCLLSFSCGLLYEVIPFGEIATNIEELVEQLMNKEFNEHSLLLLGWVANEDGALPCEFTDKELLSILKLCNYKDIIPYCLGDNRYSCITNVKYPLSLNYISEHAKQNDWLSINDKSIKYITDTKYVYEIAEEFYIKENKNILKYYPEEMLDKRLTLLKNLRS